MHHALKSAALAVLRPFVRYLITQGWTYGALAELLKFVYVGEVIALDAQAGKPDPTDSRVTLLSGIHRKEVRRIREELQAGSGQIDLRHGANLSAQVVAAWGACAAYRDAQGAPSVLPLRAAAEQPSFEALVKRVKADMRPRTVLDELLRAGVVRLDGEAVALLRRGYVSELPEDRLAFMGAHLGDHIRAAVHNLEGMSPAFLEQSMYFDRVPAAVVEGSRDALRQIGEQALQEAYQRVARGEREDTPQVQAENVPSKRLRLGVYYYEEPSAAGDVPGGQV
ncbi:MAG: DUF6502 family protein [Thiomonas sp.]